MPNQEKFQAELKEKVKAGVKPSDLKKLKRSKSADDINQVPVAPPLPIVNEQLAEKQKEIENLRKQLEQVNRALQETKQELDNSLAARVAGIKTFGNEHDKRVKTEQELNETIDEASSELITGDKQVSSLRTQLSQASRKIEELEKKWKQERIKRNTILPNSEDPHFVEGEPAPFPNLDYLKYALYSLLAVWFMMLLSKAQPTKLEIKNYD